jgi:S-adenosylmethionine hydrolase
VEGTVEVRVLCVDRFGNVVFDCPQNEVEKLFQVGHTYVLKGEKIPFCRTFSDVEPGCSLFLWNSSNYLELALRNGHAASRWGVKAGDTISVRATKSLSEQSPRRSEPETR